MKKLSILLTTAVLGFIALTAFVGLNSTTNQNDIAQNNPTYEQTVDFITKNIKGRVMYPGALDAHSRTEGYHLEDVKIDSNGRIEFITYQLNKKNDYKHNFNIVFNIFDLVEAKDYPDGIRAYNFLVHFNGLNVSSGYGIAFATDADAIKVARAFRHLKTLCNKDNNLFSQETEEEKKLSLEETVAYINNNIRFLNDYPSFFDKEERDIPKECCGFTCEKNGNATLLYVLSVRKRDENEKCSGSQWALYKIYFNVLDIENIVVSGKYLSMKFPDKRVSHYIDTSYCSDLSYHYNIGDSRHVRYVYSEALEASQVRNKPEKRAFIQMPYSNEDSDALKAKRLIKAFDRLRELCKRPVYKDPFDD